MIFESREDAGRQLAGLLMDYKDRGDVVVLALPRGGVVLGAEVARVLNAPLGLVLVRKIGHPSAPEYAIGALAETEAPVYNEAEAAGIDPRWLELAERSARETIENRRNLYYGEDFIPPEVKSKTVVVVDDGMATGLTMEASVRSLAGRGAREVAVAVPVASFESIERLEQVADRVIVVDKPENFLDAIGNHYRHFQQVDDMDVKTLLWESAAAGI